MTEDHYVIGGPVNNGGVVLRWLRDELLASEVETAKRLGVDPYDVLTKIANRETGRRWVDIPSIFSR